MTSKEWGFGRRRTTRTTTTLTIVSSSGAAAVGVKAADGQEDALLL